MHDMRRFFQRQSSIVLAELLGNFQVHLVVSQPERNLGNTCRPFLNFNTVKLINVNSNQLEHIQQKLVVLAHMAQHFQFQQTQFAISDYQKVATAAGRV